jgi:hypothetical protein
MDHPSIGIIDKKGCAYHSVIIYLPLNELKIMAPLVSIITYI